MKKFSLLIILSLIFFSVSSVRAFSWSNTGNKTSREPSRATIQQQKQDLRNRILTEREKLRGEWKAGTVSAAGKLGELHADSLTTRSIFYYDRLSGILTRLNDAIKEAENKYGVQKLAKARDLYNQAKAKLDTAKPLSDQAIAAFKDIQGNTVSDAKAALTAAREKAKLGWSAYKDAVRLMKDSVKELRVVIQANRPSPSPMPSKSPRASGDLKAIPDPIRKIKPTLPIVPPPLD